MLLGGLAIFYHSAMMLACPQLDPKPHGGGSTVQNLSPRDSSLKERWMQAFLGMKVVSS